MGVITDYNCFNFTLTQISSSNDQKDFIHTAFVENFCNVCKCTGLSGVLDESVHSNSSYVLLFLLLLFWFYLEGGKHCHGVKAEENYNKNSYELLYNDSKAK